MRAKRIRAITTAAIALLAMWIGCANPGAPPQMHGFTWADKPTKITVDGVEKDWSLETCESAFGKPLLSVRTPDGVIGFWKAPGFASTHQIYDVRAFDAEGRFVPVIGVSQNANAGEEIIRPVNSPKNE